MWAPATAPGLQLRHDVVGLLVSDPDGDQGLEDREPRRRGLVLVVADAGQLLAVRVGVVLLGAHTVPPLPLRARLATQSGSRKGVGACVPVAGARIMRQLVHGAVTAWDQDDDGLAAEAAAEPRPGEADLIGCPVAQALPRAQPPQQIAGRERDDCGGDGAYHDHHIPMVDSCSTPSGVSVAARLR